MKVTFTLVLLNLCFFFFVPFCFYQNECNVNKKKYYKQKNQNVVVLQGVTFLGVMSLKWG